LGVGTRDHPEDVSGVSQNYLKKNKRREEKEGDEELRMSSSKEERKDSKLTKTRYIFKKTKENFQAGGIHQPSGKKGRSEFT